MRRTVAIVLVACLLSPPGSALDVSAAYAPPRRAVGVQRPAQLGDDRAAAIRLAAGTKIRLRLLDSISSVTARPGSTIALEVSGNVKVGDLVVILDSAPASGTIDSVERAGRAWQAGRIRLRLNTVTLLDGQQASLRGYHEAKGPSTHAVEQWVYGTLATLGLVLLFLPAAPLQHGNEAVLPAGTTIDVTIDKDALLPRSVVEAAQPTPVLNVSDLPAVELDRIQPKIGPERTPPAPVPKPRGEIATVFGLYEISSTNQGVDYEPSASWTVGANGGVPIGHHLAVQVGIDVGNYSNDRYYAQEEPHNPYLATARVVSFASGLRYDFRSPAARLRPFLGGGLVLATFTNVNRGPKDFCIDSGCIAMAPELFYGTRASGYFDLGAHVRVSRAWALRVGIRAYPLPGDETDTVGTTRSPGDATGSDTFWHSQLYVGPVYRWK